MEERWHFSKSVSITHIITTVTIVVAAIVSVSDIKEDVAVQGTKIANMEKTIETRVKEHEEMFSKIDTKLDKLFELIYTGTRND